MKKLTGLLFALVIVLCAGSTVFAAPEDVPDYIRVGISTGSVGDSYSASAGSELKIYEYSNGGVSLRENLGVTEVTMKADSEYINIYEAGNESGAPLISLYNQEFCFLGCSDIKNGILSFDGKNYRGGILLYRTGSTIRVINVLNTEKYLYGVVPNEMPSSYPVEALKAQAVAARSFAMDNLGRHQSQGYDICNTQHCQVYGGVAKEVAKCSSAVDETDGMVAYYNGNPVACYYSANNGGYIESSKDIWGTDVGYLQAKKDEYNPPYQWSVSYTKSEVEALLKSAGYNIGSFSGVKVLSYTEGGSVASLEFTGSTGKAVVNTSKIRSLFGSSKVKSLRFKIKGGTLSSGEAVLKASAKGVSGSATERVLTGLSVIDKNGNVVKIDGTSVTAQGSGGKTTIAASSEGTGTGTTEGIEINGNGYGHCIGMSQMGARVMAEQGFDYEEILKFYYEGIRVE